MARLKSLEGRHVLVTGAAGGIGSAVARTMFLEEGANIVLTDRNAEGLRELAKELEANPARREGSRVVVETADLSSGEEIDRLVERLRGERIDVLVNNAGIVHAGPFESMDPGTIDRILAVNLLAVVRLTRGLVSRLRENRGGHIVNIASGAGLFGPGGLAAYAAAKFGVVGFSQSLRAELAAEEIGVSVVCPGYVRTRIVANSLLAGAPARPDRFPPGEGGPPPPSPRIGSL
ncbi:MAG: SDR family oxidoreductase, partial [Planctomycetes bacterium]|nr:SDR family oxidoreductase [Planctomycetota bacterium]